MGRREIVVLSVLLAAFALLLYNGTSFFVRLDRGVEGITAQLGVSATTITLNIALILFGWRYYVDVQHEIQRREESERRAQEQASTDGMTGLLNRKGFTEAGHWIHEKGEPDAGSVAVISIQLNRFKTINERHGFDVGDELLRRIAGVIVEVADGSASVARVSGDEFAIIASPGGRNDRESIEALAVELLDRVTRPFSIDDKSIQVGAHVGIAQAPVGELKARDLLRRADIALAAGKAGRLARPIWFDEGMERELLVHSEIEQGIRHGVDTDQFLPFFEPQIDFATGQISGFEVLARWNHPLAGLITPDRFIPVAEEHHLIGPLTDGLFRRALRIAAAWPNEIDLSINIAPSQLADNWLAQKLVRMLTETGFPAERLIVEITEGSLFADIEMARTIVTSMKNQGIRIALDDFGTGFSSLSHLRAMPLDLIKIDRSFVSSLATDRESRAIVRAITTLADALDTPVVVEGVENARTHAMVMEMGCRFGQGWYFGKPMTADQAEQLLRQPGASALTDPDTAGDPKPEAIDDGSSETQVAG
ncbi:bifunctional diguanylate cyclase/phosphodiesterase [Sphingomicrobium sp. XHP0239]|uniref:putative bifunctional diguanylate cyclase/phosphodiesterase n=1 Tax=Sphingomicrobium maritimum TaxID=3133972 RepID=UPI0031CC6127